MADALKLCVIGGSNSLMSSGYTPPLVALLERNTGRRVELRNLAIGGTTCQFGLWHTVTKKSHIGADIIIVEYALNDAILARFAINQQWAKAYEGLLARLRKDNPTAQILSPLLFTQNNTGRIQLTGIAAGVAMINMRYGVATIDVTQRLAAKVPVNFWNSHNDWFRDPSHYNKFLQVMIAEMVADGIIKGDGRAADGHFVPVVPGHFINAQSAVAAGKFAAMVPPSTEFREFSNSLTSMRAAMLQEGGALKFKIQGTVIAVIVASTRADGVVCIQFGSSKTYMSLRRTGLDEDLKFTFFLNVVIPDQYSGKQLCTSSDKLEEFSIRLLSDAEAGRVGDGNVHYRGTARMPDAGTHELAVIDVLFDARRDGLQPAWADAEPVADL